MIRCLDKDLHEQVPNGPEEMLATLAHELLQPLAAIVGAARIIERRVDVASGERARRTLERQVTRVVRLLEDLLETIHTRRANLDLRRRRLDVREAVEAAIEAVRPRAEQEGQHLAIFVPSVPIWVDADPERIQQILSNLLSNALKHTPKGQRVWAHAGQSGTRVVLTVGDDGDGIPADALQRIFEMFSQGSQNRGTGYGIGLAVVKQLTELHGGTVQAFSDGQGRGSRFVVEFPDPTASRLLAAGA